MGTPLPPENVLLSLAVLSADPEALEKARAAVQALWGAITEESPAIPFSFSDYYEPEMGPGLQRRFWGFETPVSPGDIGRIKTQANLVEAQLSQETRRTVNLDPGYVSLAKVVVPSTKDATYRIYLHDGIYAQPMLFFRAGSFRPWPWTYADYQSPGAVAFFNGFRARLKTPRNPPSRPV